MRTMAQKLYRQCLSAVCHDLERNQAEAESTIRSLRRQYSAEEVTQAITWYKDLVVAIVNISEMEEGHRASAVTAIAERYNQTEVDAVCQALDKRYART